MLIGACLKWVHQRPEVHLASGAVDTSDDRFGGVSPSDQAALEWALRCAEVWGAEVLAVVGGPAGADGVVRDALAAGAARAVRVDLSAGAGSSVVAGALAPLLRPCSLVWCGDASTDRGSGAVPAYLAAHLAAGQALGLVEVTLGPAPGELAAIRRLDGGRREVLAVRGTAVLSVEGGTARLRRAPLGAALWARQAPVEVVPGTPLGEHPHRPTRPYRPRARALAAPAGATALERVRALTALGHGAGPTRGDPEVLGPEAAADRILGALREWGYLDPASQP